MAAAQRRIKSAAISSTILQRSCEDIPEAAYLLAAGKRKKDGFKALVYLHRYDKYTIARVRTDYLHPLQHKYEAEIKRLEMLSVSTDNAREKAAYRKEIENLQSKIEECRVYDQVVAHHSPSADRA
jgi:hypothetical protein